MVCGKIIHYCPSPSWARASKQVGLTRTRIILSWTKYHESRWLAWAVIWDSWVTWTMCSGWGSQIFECAWLHFNTWKGWESHPVSSFSNIKHSTHRKDEASRCDTNGFSKPHSYIRACCAVSQIESKLSAPFHTFGHPPTHQMQSWPWPGFEQTPCRKLSMPLLCLIIFPLAITRKWCSSIALKQRHELPVKKQAAPYRITV